LDLQNLTAASVILEGSAFQEEEIACVKDGTQGHVSGIANCFMCPVVTSGLMIRSCGKSLEEQVGVKSSLQAEKGTSKTIPGKYFTFLEVK